MVKIHCDRCGKEIEKTYYTINIYSYDVDPKPEYTACCADSYSAGRDGALRMLNSVRMYCGEYGER